MTRKDYIALAGALAAARPPDGPSGSCDRYGYEVWYHVFARAFGQESIALTVGNTEFVGG